MVAPLGVDLGASFDSFQHGAQEFFHRLSEIGWLSMAVALAFYLAHLLARSRAWQNVLRAAYPDRKVPFARIAAAYLVGAGMNSVVPARVGDAVKIFLAKRSIRRSTYPTVVSSFFVGSVFDTSAGILVFVYALTQGLLPKPPELPDLPAFDIAFWAQHPDLLIFTLTALAIVVVVAFALLARHVEAFWDRVKQGAIVLATPDGLSEDGRLLAGVRLGPSLLLLLVLPQRFPHRGLLPERPPGDERADRFDAPAPDARVAPAPSRHSSSRPWSDPGPIAVLTYSVGQQIAVAAWTVILGTLALIFVFRTTNWRSLIRSASREADQHAKA